MLKLEQKAKSQGLVLLLEFNFKHVLYFVTELAITPEGLMYAYTKCAAFLSVKDMEKEGMTLIVTPKWVMLVPLKDAYLFTEDGCPVYLDGFAFTGLFNLQKLSSKWPETISSAYSSPITI